MAEATSSDTITMEILLRYKEVSKSIPAKDRLRAPSILHATSQNLLVDALAILHGRIDTKETDEIGRTSLHWAAIRGWTEVVVGLIEVGAEPDSGDNFQRTALSYASEGGYLEVVQVLVSAGSFPNKEDKAHRTPLSYAAASGNSSVVEFLIKDVRVACDTTDNDGQSPLHWAAKSNSSAVVAKLLQASKFKQNFINAEDNDGKTPLITALSNGKADMARLLISGGASCAVQVGDIPAWQWFIEKGDPKSARFLLQELDNMVTAQNGLSELAVRNSAVIYIFLQTAGEPSQQMIDYLEHDYFQPETFLKTTFVNKKWDSCTMKSLEKAANEEYGAIAIFSGIGQQQETRKREITSCAISTSFGLLLGGGSRGGCGRGSSRE
ncbi:ankyrin repeat domain-containing protein [Aspergillus foveolatus]|uniref:ankyrin repeat domain-containing protein n=1 Tax=Aspergillus foveolatus TaxID=210207 RepID=UPI003CCD2503